MGDSRRRKVDEALSQIRSSIKSLDEKVDHEADDIRRFMDDNHKILHKRVDERHDHCMHWRTPPKSTLRSKGTSISRSTRRTTTLIPRRIRSSLTYGSRMKICTRRLMTGLMESSDIMPTSLKRPQSDLMLWTFASVACRVPAV